MKIIVALIMLAVCFVSCHTLNERLGVKDDNIVEELVEEAVLYETGADVDFTPVYPSKE